MASSGASAYRFGQYLEDSRFGRWFWLVAAVTQLLLFAGLPFLLVWGIWERSDLDRGDPVRIGIVAIVAVLFWCAALVWQGSVRAMVRHLSAPRREWDPGDDEEQALSEGGS
ncbi:hypothetical protein [Oryzobacter terrae]|uniref:hypothetical protein n=1 Tax=Oryzobacter terrae TaxID=1620385 RepID=UPI00366C8195